MQISSFSFVQLFYHAYRVYIIVYIYIYAIYFLLRHGNN